MGVGLYMRIHKARRDEAEKRITATPAAQAEPLPTEPVVSAPAQQDQNRHEERRGRR